MRFHAARDFRTLVSLSKLFGTLGPYHALQRLFKTLRPCYALLGSPGLSNSAVDFEAVRTFELWYTFQCSLGLSNLTTHINAVQDIRTLLQVPRQSRTLEPCYTVQDIRTLLSIMVLRPFAQETDWSLYCDESLKKLVDNSAAFAQEID